MSDWLEAEKRIERAQLLSESQQWAEALTELEAALAINPDNATWNAQRGVLLEELQRWEDAAEAFERAHQLDASDPDIAVALGEARAKLGQFGRALSVFEDLADRYPDFEPAYCCRIHIYAELGRHEQAEEMFYQAQQLHETCPRCFLYVGASLAARKLYERAIYCWERALELESDCIGVNRRIAQAYRAQGKLEEAHEYYLREMRDDPGNPDLLAEIAEMSLESGQVATAAAKYAHVLELEPQHVHSNYALGKIWLLRGQPKKALEYLESADSLADEASKPRGLSVLIGEALFQQKQYKEACERLAIALERNPDLLEARLVLGNCQLAMEKLERARSTFQKVLAHDADHAVAHHQLGVCLSRLGRHEVALKHSLKALKTRPDFLPAMTTSAVGYIRLGQWRNAKSMLRKAIRHDPNNADLTRLLKRMWIYRVRRAAGRVASWFGRGSA